MVNIEFPIKLAKNRVWRTYQGGAKLNDLQNRNDDIYFPEEWIASTVVARNVGREHIQNEGLSVLEANENISLKDIIEQNHTQCLGDKSNMGVLVKIIDSSERLTIQVHPDKTKAMELFSSEYGKTESWYILNKPNEGKQPYIYLGFKEGVTREHWKHLFDTQNIEGMLECLHKFDVKEGDTVLIEGGIPHAIGENCFLLETQEPTDYTIRVEKTTPAGLTIADSMCHQGLGFDKMFDCFNYDGKSRQETYDKWFIKPTNISEEITGIIDIPFFGAQKIEVDGNLKLNLNDEFSVLYVLEGEGELKVGDKVEKISASDQLFVPSIIKELEFNSTTPLKIVQCFGPK
ncbi:MAG: hypothetical protein ATN35_08880 [Epulopiscium sp. Nele67-Bin004]|nr:MAG: hypothetical protein ATN35_08880 [Epulopiscium sp. Nele67-Bin004]